MKTSAESLDLDAGKRMHSFARELWSIPRSLTGNGVRETLRRIQEKIPSLVIHEIPSGSRVGDWEVPLEWNLNHAVLKDANGNTICDSAENNLHVLGYSIPIECEISLDELQEHLYSIPENPDAVPYITSYYERRWGFCLAHRIRESLQPGKYTVRIDSALTNGSLTYADCVLPGESDSEILISTYICHPSMANNELSGPVVATELARYLLNCNHRRYTYRFVFAPETIGAISYIHLHHAHLRERVRAGLNLTCVGDDRGFSLLPTREGNHKIDQVARHVLSHIAENFKEYPWTARGSDERQYSAPLVEIPMISVMRTKYWEYPEYHTSLDDLERVVTPAGLGGGYEAIRRVIDVLENDVRPTTIILGEPMLGKRGLYSSIGAGRISVGSTELLDVWSYCGGTKSAFEIAEKLCLPFDAVRSAITTLMKHGIVTIKPELL